MEENVINIRDIQHFLYCPHRFGLMKIDTAWSENLFVTKANLLHERVHNTDSTYTLRGRKVYTALNIYFDEPEFNLYGVLDCLEYIRHSDKGEYCIVEYKPTAPKGIAFRREDALQVFAQKLCVDSIFACDAECCIYHADTKKRVRLPFNKEYEQYGEYKAELKGILSQMRHYMKEGIIPPIVRGQKCNGCSMQDICLPKAVDTSRSPSIRQQILAEGRGLE